MIIYTLEVFLIGGPVTEEFAKKNPVVSRTIEIRGDQSLADLHDAIFRAFNREEEHLFEFQIGGKGPNDPKARKYGLVIPDDDIFGGYEESDVTDTTIDSLKLKKKQSFGYWFDFGDDWWHQIDVISIEQKDSKESIQEFQSVLDKVRHNMLISKNEVTRIKTVPNTACTGRLGASQCAFFGLILS